MFAVIFEVQPKRERFDEYLGLAKLLRPEIEKIDGFIDNERFRSQTIEGRILSLSTWRDEKALIRWRTLAAHHKVQEKGRFVVFEDYHLRVGEITADTHGSSADPPAGQRFDETEIGEAKSVSISELAPSGGRSLALPEIGSAGLVARESFESITDAGKRLVLASWHGGADAEHWVAATRSGTAHRHRLVRIIRDYGMRDRREAPQYYPPVPIA
jgi:heme-degrading monooxygenase HmoA